MMFDKPPILIIRQGVGPVTNRKSIVLKKTLLFSTTQIDLKRKTMHFLYSRSWMKLESSYKYNMIKHTLEAFQSTQ